MTNTTELSPAQQETAEAKKIRASFKKGTFKNEVITTPVGTLIYPHLVKPVEEAFQDSKAKLSETTERVNFQVQLGLNKTPENEKWFNEYQKTLEKCMAECGHPKWSKKWKLLSNPVDADHPPLLDGDLHLEEKWSGQYIVKAKLKTPYVHGHKTFNPLSMINVDQEFIDPSTFYEGCQVRVMLYPYCWANQAGKLGITLKLSCLQFIRDGSSITTMPLIDTYKEELNSVSLDSDDK